MIYLLLIILVPSILICTLKLSQDISNQEDDNSIPSLITPEESLRRRLNDDFPEA